MSNLRCPHCGQRIELNIGPVAPARSRKLPGVTVFHSSKRTIFQSDAAAVAPNLPAGYTAERQSPAFLPTKEANVIVPLLESLITGAFVGVCTIAGVTWYRASFLDGLAWGGISLLAASFVQWIRLTGSYRNLLWRLETVTGLDVDGSGEVGEPEPPKPPPIQVQVQQGQSWQFAELPGDPAMLHLFAQKVTGGVVTFSEAGARQTGYGAANFGLLRDVFIARHWAAWNHPTQRSQGVSLRQSGKTILEQITQTPPPKIISDDN